jgi:hypothetical protein
MEIFGDIICLSTGQRAEDAFDTVGIDQKTDDLLVVNLEEGGKLQTVQRTHSICGTYIQLGKYCWVHVSVVTVGKVEQLPCVFDNSRSILGFSTIVVEGTGWQEKR